MPSEWDDNYSGYFVDVWKVEADDGGAVMSGRWKEPRSKFDFYRQLLKDWDELEVRSSFSGLLEWLIANSRMSVPLFTALFVYLATPGVLSLRSNITFLVQHEEAGERKPKSESLIFSVYFLLLMSGFGRLLSPEL